MEFTLRKIRSFAAAQNDIEGFTMTNAAFS
jgi:hypothetical protein